MAPKICRVDTKQIKANKLLKTVSFSLNRFTPLKSSTISTARQIIINVLDARNDVSPPLYNESVFELTDGYAERMLSACNVIKLKLRMRSNSLLLRSGVRKGK